VADHSLSEHPPTQPRERAEHQMMEYGRRMRKRAELAESKLRRIKDLSSVPSLQKMVNGAYAPRRHPDHPGVEIERSNPTAFIEGYTTALNRVIEIITEGVK
jgi:hypothetical protein